MWHREAGRLPRVHGLPTARQSQGNEGIKQCGDQVHDVLQFRVESRRLRRDGPGGGYCLNWGRKKLAARAAQQQTQRQGEDADSKVRGLEREDHAGTLTAPVRSVKVGAAVRVISPFMRRCKLVTSRRFLHSARLL